MRFSTWIVSLFALTGLVTACPAEVRFGLLVGTPATDLGELSGSSTAIASQVLSNYRTYTDRVTGGPTISVGLGKAASFEVSAVYKRFGYTANGSEGTPAIEGDTRALEVPVVLKLYRPGATGRARTFWGVGIIGRKQLGGAVASKEIVGATFALGRDVVVGGAKLSFEVRYVLWGIRKFGTLDAALLSESTNQADVLVGLSF